ncbi:M4 family metallopeptidase [Nocardioides sp. LML1-1-1.1]|uniref:M4 family metallopeptidase n=1 Tax=Nocardioides sp. LML1-1-1.1 TaxID=3135248 RepID=UPI0034374699
MRRTLALACAAAVSATTLAAVSLPGAEADPGNGEASLRADADGPLRIRKEAGVATYVGAPVGTDIDNPAVGRATSVSDAARAHLRRYGAVVGADRPGTRLVAEGPARPLGRGDLVRYQQQVGGVPVLGGEVVVGVGADRELESINAHLTDATALPEATVSEAAARATAEERVRKTGRASLAVTDQGRWLLDPDAVGMDPALGTRGVWRFEVRSGVDVRRLVLVDDRSGDVLRDVDLVQEIDRVVCDQKNVRAADVPCTSGAIRTEGSGDSGLADAEAAFANAKAVSDFYLQVVSLDLTTAIGVPTAEGPKLASTVRVCVPESSESCPWANAFWNGSAMFYGQGYAGADDVVGHEMTHGVIERTSGLLYWDEPGAINESLADIIGEIVDHRTPSAGDSATDWRLGEDLPDGAARDMADPTVFGQPDRMTSALWAADPRYVDNGGVHTNSGVGNKTFHLISQGGTFNGQTVTGIDTGDPSLTKSATLWVSTMGALTAFTEYADLAVVLDQTCTALIGFRGFTAADCASVRKATTATELATPPVSDPVKDAPRTCPEGRFPRELFNSETGPDPAAKFTKDSVWGRTPTTTVNKEYGVNAYSGDTAWVGGEPSGKGAWSLRTSDAITVPSDQATYLAFRHWHLFEFDIDPSDGTPYWWDGGTVELGTDDGTTYSLANRPWDFGPTRALQDPNAGRRAFAGSSRGWVGSRVDLSAYAGLAVHPTFTVRTDTTNGGPGWYVDDIVVYTCDPRLEPTSAPSVADPRPRVGVPSSVGGDLWNLPLAGREYQWRRNGVAISGARGLRYTPVAADYGQVLSVTITALSGVQRVPVVATAPARVAAGRISAPPTIRIAGTPYVGRRLTAVRNTWWPTPLVFTYRWYRDGRPITGATRSTYVLKKADRRHRVTVRITASRAGYATTYRTAASVLVRR